MKKLNAKWVNPPFSPLFDRLKHDELHALNIIQSVLRSLDISTAQLLKGMREICGDGMGLDFLELAQLRDCERLESFAAVNTVRAWPFTVELAFCEVTGDQRLFRYRLAQRKRMRRDAKKVAALKAAEASLRHAFLYIQAQCSGKKVEVEGAQVLIPNVPLRDALNALRIAEKSVSLGDGHYGDCCPSFSRANNKGVANAA